MKPDEASVFLEFDLEDNSEKVIDYGKLEKEPKLATYVVCPLCGMSRKLNKTGLYSIQKLKRERGIATIAGLRKLAKDIAEKKEVKSRAKIYNPEKDTRFDIVDLKKAPFWSIRQSYGKGSEADKRGLKEVFVVRLSDIKNLPENDKKLALDLIKQIRAQCERILKATEKLTR